MMTGFEQYARKTRRAIFLEEMEQVVPWRELCALVEPYYPKPGNRRPPVGVERMLRIYFLQQWFNLSDPAVEESLYDSAGMRQFVGVDLGCAPVPELLRSLIALEAPRLFEMLQRQYSRVETDRASAKATILEWNRTELPTCPPPHTILRL